MGLPLFFLVWPIMIGYATYFDIFTAWRLYGSFDVEELVRTIAFGLQLGNDELMTLLTIVVPFALYFIPSLSSSLTVTANTLLAYYVLELTSFHIPYAVYILYAYFGTYMSPQINPFWFDIFY
jgi:hypothetical protein